MKIKNTFSEIKQSKYFLLFIFLFSYIKSVQLRFLVREQFSWYLFTPEAAVINFISACILFLIMRLVLLRWQKLSKFSFNDALKIFGISLLLFLLIMESLGLLTALAFNTFERNFNQDTLIITTISDVLDAIIYGSFFLAFYYYRKNNKNQEEKASYIKSLSEIKINQLKTQLNPHFLFNNLNILDQLIEEDKRTASDFLNEFAEIYRYVLQVSDKRLIGINEELSFAKKYFNLVQYKYGRKYLLEIEGNKSCGSIVPLTLQLLLENAVQHNLGTEENPIIIKVRVDDKLVVSNNLIQKRNLKITSGRALNNLKEQYNLLSDGQIDIRHSETTFCVTIPIILLDNNDQSNHYRR